MNGSVALALKVLEGHRLLASVGGSAFLLTPMGRGLVIKAREKPENEALYQDMVGSGLSEALAGLALLMTLTERTIIEWNTSAGMAGESIG